ncbi:MAG: carboxypeptidase regulatory-like domain-containing protein [Clostridia bacterium]|nr:carboxypeptidase regulatory-like domain-containing protein [Clostridia bacterium]
MKRTLSIILSIAMLITMLPATLAFAEDTKTFTDVEGTEYYAQAAEALSVLDILAGYEDGSFGADKSITRAEMAAITCRVIDKESDAEKAAGETKFDDVAANHWASGYINIASDEGIINGDGNGKFRPEDDVKYEEAIKMVVCALGFDDGITVDPDDWSAGYLAAAKDKGITNSLKGRKGKASTRGDVAQMVFDGLKAELIAPIASLEAGTYTGTKSITLTTATKDAEIYYTIDGTTPTAKSTKYTKAISLTTGTKKLQAIAVKNGVLVSDIFSGEYIIKSSGGGGGGGGGSTTDRTAPTLTFEKTGMEIGDGIIQTSSDTIILKGKATDNKAIKSIVGVNVTNTGDENTLTVNGLEDFEITIPLSIGGNNISVTVTDVSNNTKIESIHVDRLSTEVTFASTLKTTDVEDTQTVYDSIVCFWNEGEDTEDYSDDYTCVLMQETSPLINAIRTNKLAIGDTYALPQSEQFLVGFIGTIEGTFESDDTGSYPANEYEVVRFSTPSLDELFGGDVRLDFSGGIDSENPIAFIMLPDGTQCSIDDGGEISLMAAQENFTTPGWQPKELVKGLIPTFSNTSNGNQNKTDLLIKLNDVVIYDKDGSITTKNDQITVGGQFGIKDLKHIGGVEWHPNFWPWSFDVLPQQILSKTTYETVSELKANYKAEIDTGDFVKAMNGGFDNRREFMGLGISGVEFDKKIVLASFGVSIAIPTVTGTIQSISNQSVAIPFNPILLFSIILDLDGSVKGEVTLTFSYNSYNEKGFNLQKKDFSGAYGSLNNNLGQKSYQLPFDRQLEIFDVCGQSASKKNEKPSLEVQLEGSAEAKFEIGAGINAGVMIAGIMPASVSGVVFYRAEANMEGSIALNNDGFDIDGNASFSQGVGGRVNGDFRLIAKGFNWEGGLEKSFEWEKMFLESGIATTKMTGTVTAADGDRDNSNNPIIADAIVTLKRTDDLSAQPNTVKTNAEGYYEFPSVLSGIYEVKFEKTGYTSYTASDVDVGNSNKTLDVVLDTLYSNQVTGKVTIADTDTNDTNNVALAGAKVTIAKITGSQSLTKSTQTGTDGIYTISELPAGLYTVTVEKTGHIPLIQTIVIKQGQINYYNATLESIPNEFEGNGYASGIVYDVLTGSGVSDLTLNIRNGLNNIDNGEVVSVLTTSNDGSYITGSLPAGNYCVQILDERSLSDENDRYLQNMFNIKVLGNKTITAQNGVVTNSLDVSQMRIVLKWGELPRDLDSHLVGPTLNGGLFHTYYAKKSNYENNTKMADLDLDDVSSYGPETTTIYKPVSGKYCFYIHDYSNRGSSNSTSLANSGAYVQVFHEASPVPLYTFSVPQGEGTLWTVFEYDSVTSQVTPINEMSYYFGGTGNIGLMSVGTSETSDEYVKLIFNDIAINEKIE